MLDVRKPIGYLFTLIGAILAVYGLIQPQMITLDVVGTPTTYTLNLDLPWGVIMLLFGLFMLVLEHYDRRKKDKARLLVD